MRIQTMTVTPVAIADPPLRNSSGVHEPYSSRAIVELVGEDGRSGFGEIACNSRTVAEIEAVRDLVVGQDPLHLSAIGRSIGRRLDPAAAPTDHLDRVLQAADQTRRRRSTAAQRTFSPIEVAALDLAGQTLGVPVCDLLGGRFRERVPFSAYLFYKHEGGGGEGDDARDDPWGEALGPEALVAQAQTMVADYGFRSLKLKAGVLPPEEEIATMLLLREAFGPEMPLRIDPNCAWTVETSVRIGTALAGTLEYFEDPTPGIPGMAAVRRDLLAAGIDLPLATNMAVTGYDDLPEAIRTDAVQVVLGDHHYWGGPHAVVQLGRLCETFGIGLSMHSNSHLGISLMAMVHLGAATPHLTYDSDSHYPWQHAGDEIVVGGKIAFTDGAIPVPTGPGLGIAIDRHALARGHERYLRIPYRDRDDEGEMRRRYDPAWERRIPRW